MRAAIPGACRRLAALVPSLRSTLVGRSIQIGHPTKDHGCSRSKPCRPLAAGPQHQPISIGDKRTLPRSTLSARRTGDPKPNELVHHGAEVRILPLADGDALFYIDEAEPAIRSRHENVIDGSARLQLNPYRDGRAGQAQEFGPRISKDVDAQECSDFVLESDSSLSCTSSRHIRESPMPLDFTRQRQGQMSSAGAVRSFGFEVASLRA